MRVIDENAKMEAARFLRLVHTDALDDALQGGATLVDGFGSDAAKIQELAKQAHEAIGALFGIMWWRRLESEKLSKEAERAVSAWSSDSLNRTSDEETGRELMERWFGCAHDSDEEFMEDLTYLERE